MNAMSRKRQPVFTSEEVHTLISLVERYSKIIENKKSDAKMWKQKEDIWGLIVDQLAAQSGLKRSIASVRFKYENLKKKAKKEIADSMEFIPGVGMKEVSLGSQRIAALMDGSILDLKATHPYVDYEQSDNETAAIDDPLNGIENENWPTRIPKIERSESLSEQNNHSKRKASDSPIPRDRKKKKLDLIAAIEHYFINEDIRSREKHEWEHERHQLELQEREMKINLMRIQLELSNRQLHDV